METAVVCSGRNVPHWSKGPVAGDAQAAALVGGGDEAEEQLRAHGIERGEAELIDDDQVIAKQAVDELADRVVSQPAIERLDQVSGGEVPDAAPRGHRRMAGADQQM